MPFDFIGKKILVTGAGKGIGRGVAIALSQAGCKVYALSRTKSTLDSLYEECDNIVPIVTDLCNWDETKKELEKLEVLDGLVNNAGIGAFECPALECSREYICKILDNNLLSAINCTQVIAKKMVESNIKGSIVNVSSIGSLCAYPNGLPYVLSKAAMDMVSKQFALELGPHGIRVNSVNPTLVVTPMVLDLMERGIKPEEYIVSRTPMGRVAEVEDIVEPILYLLGDHSRIVTGQMHVVDGGMTYNLAVKSTI